MNTYRFILEIPAYSQAEAKAKMDLLLQWAAFPKDLDVTSLAGSLVQYFVLNRVEKFLASSGQTPTNTSKVCKEAATVK